MGRGAAWQRLVHRQYCMPTTPVLPHHMQCLIQEVGNDWRDETWTFPQVCGLHALLLPVADGSSRLPLCRPCRVALRRSAWRRTRCRAGSATCGGASGRLCTRRTEGSAGSCVVLLSVAAACHDSGRSAACNLLSWPLAVRLLAATRLTTMWLSSFWIRTPSLASPSSCPRVSWAPALVACMRGA